MTLWVIFIWPLWTSCCPNSWHLKQVRWITPYISLYWPQRDPLSTRYLKLEEINPTLYLLSLHFAADIRKQWDLSCLWSLHHCCQDQIPGSDALLPGQTDTPCCGWIRIYSCWFLVRVLLFVFCLLWEFILHLHVRFLISKMGNFGGVLVLGLKCCRNTRLTEMLW